uniref:Pebble n=1 Tax=Timema shepardi TaxID=629360 RepID=A0A7R9G0M6_TIMSH|nr:unnamed protein product [Timema shepardi]
MYKNETCLWEVKSKEYVNQGRKAAVYDRLAQLLKTLDLGENLPIRESLDTRICLVGKTRTDANVISAAQRFGVPVVSSDTGAEFLNDGSWDTVYVVGDFSGPVYEAIHRSEQRVLGPTALQQCSERGEGLPNNARPLYTMAMCGLIVCFTGFRKKDELTRLISLIHNMGGSIRKDMVSKVTHLIANQSGGDKYQYAVTFRVPIMAESWVHTCWERRNDPAINALTDDMMACHKLLPLQGARVCFHGFPDDERDHMAEVLLENGGISVDLEDFTCTHVVADSEETFNILKANLGLPNDPAHSPKSTFETNDLTSSMHSPVRHLASESWHTSTPGQGSPGKVPSPIPLSPVRQLKESESLDVTLVEAHQNFAVTNQQPVTSLSCQKSKVFSSFSKKNRCRASLPGPGYFLRRCKIPAPIFLNTLPKMTTESILMEEDETDVDGGEIAPPPRYNTPKLRRLSGTSAGHPGSYSLLSCPESSGNPSTIQEEDRPLTMVVDESIVQNIPEKAPLKAAIVKVEWFWASIQNEVCSDEKDYLFEDVKSGGERRGKGGKGREGGTERGFCRSPRELEEASRIVQAQETTTKRTELLSLVYLGLGFLLEPRYLESLLSPGRNSAHGTPGSSTRPRKRKRLRDTMSRLLQTESPAVQKRRSSVSDAGFLSVSGSFLDTTPGSPDNLFPFSYLECVTEKLEALEKEILRCCDVCDVEEGVEGCVEILMNVQEREGEAWGEGGGSVVKEDPVAADTPRKNLTARQQVFIELLQTEINYVNILDTIMKLFKAPLEDMLDTESPLLSKIELNTIFGHLGPIHDIHKKMLEDLKWTSAHWKEDICIGDIVLKFAPDLVKAYPQFVNFFEGTKNMIVQCDQTRPRFHAFLKICQTRPECGRQSLQELLIRPVQRLPSISLLLNDILKHTDKKNPDHSALERALSAIREVMTYINEDKRKTENQFVMFGIFNDIDCCPPNLVSAQRNFVSRVDVMELSEGLSGRGDTLVLFLFSDTLEVCKRRNNKGHNSMKSPNTSSLTRQASGKPYKHIRLMPLTNIKKVIDIKETNDCHNVFALMCRSPEEFKERLFSFTIMDDETDKGVFLKTLCRQMANAICRPDAVSV